MVENRAVGMPGVFINGVRRFSSTASVCSKVWDAGVAVARLLDNCPALVRGRTVIDLGCGGSAVCVRLALGRRRVT